MIQIGTDRLWSEAELLKRLKAFAVGQPEIDGVDYEITESRIQVIAIMLDRDVDFIRGALRIREGDRG
ncbi:MAG: hypothetical protein ACLQJ7_00360 [Syntrophobacteraceae bacterium]